MTQTPERGIRDDGWLAYNIWEHSRIVKELYAQRCLKQAEEMTCAAQAAELLAPHLVAGDSLLDAGCGSGYFFHSLKDRGLPANYWGLDSAPSLIGLGRSLMPAHGLPPERLKYLRIEDLHGTADHVVCMNVLSNIDNFHRPLERLAAVAQKTLVIRESIKDGAHYSYVRDAFLDDGAPLNVYVNAYDQAEIRTFLEARGFKVSFHVDRRTGGLPEKVIGHDHWWQFLVGVKQA